MHRRIFYLALPCFLALIISNWGCTKIDTTTIGSDLIPVVDNINTFVDTLSINTTQEVFNDSTRLTLYEDYVVGKISNDPLLGQTDARLFLQLKPPFYPFYFGSAGDTVVVIDSVVLCLNYKGFFGDSTTPVTFTVNEVAQSAHGEWDSLGSYTNPNTRGLNYAPAVGNSLVDMPTTVSIPSMDDSLTINNGGEKVANQIRIKLSSAFALALKTRDSAVNGNGAFLRDTLFRAFNNGFAVTATSGNSLMYVNLTDQKTRLEVHYKRRNGQLDTTSYSFYFNDGAAGTSAPRRGAVANNIVRTRGALPAGDQEIYLQTTPGTYANVTIPGLTGYSKRIIHRAEIQIEQIPDNVVTDGYFPAPNFVYVDLKDSTSDPRWKPIYFDLNPATSYDPDNTSGLPFYPSGFTVDQPYFGGYLRKKQDGAIQRGYYHVNITRYLQRLVNTQTTNYQMRLYSPQSVSYPQYVAASVNPFIPYNNSVAYGRINIGGGANTNPDYRMKLRVIYSNLKQ